MTIERFYEKLSKSRWKSKNCIIAKELVYTYSEETVTNFESRSIAERAENTETEETRKGRKVSLE